MSAPGRPKRESLPQSGKVSCINAPGRLSRESFRQRTDKAAR